MILRLNGKVLADFRFGGIKYMELELVIPPGLLNDGANQCEVILPGDLGVPAALEEDSDALVYPRLFQSVNGALGLQAADPALLYPVSSLYTALLCPQQG